MLSGQVLCGRHHLEWIDLNRRHRRDSAGLRIGIIRRSNAAQVKLVLGMNEHRADTQQLWRLLRLRRNRLRNRSAADQRDELAPLHHSITSSARASSVGGTVRPSILAVSALMTNSNLLDCITGRSAGFAPLRMRPT
jgi:hypothetical protein